MHIRPVPLDCENHHSYNCLLKFVRCNYHHLSSYSAITSSHANVSLWNNYFCGLSGACKTVHDIVRREFHDVFRCEGLLNVEGKFTYYRKSQL